MQKCICMRALCGPRASVQPCPDAVLPSHPSLVKLPPRRRVRTLIHTLAHALTRA